MTDLSALLDPSTASGRAVALGVLVLLVLAVGTWRRHRDGRARPVAGGLRLSAAELGGPLGERATLVQVSTQVCGQCRTLRRVLGGLVPELVGVRHLELLAEDHLDLVRRLDVHRTPTLFVLDAEGRVSARVTGVPTRAEILRAVEVAS